MAHYCKYFVVHCMDFRLPEKIHDYLKERGILGNGDVVSIAGGVKDTDYMLGQLDIAVRLHGVQEVVLMNHTDCGAYGGSSNFGSPDDECAFQTEELKKAKALIAAKYPTLTIQMVIAKILPLDEVAFQEVN